MYETNGMYLLMNTKNRYTSKYLNITNAFKFDFQCCTEWNTQHSL